MSPVLKRHLQDMLASRRPRQFGWSRCGRPTVSSRLAAHDVGPHALDLTEAEIADLLVSDQRADERRDVVVRRRKVGGLIVNRAGRP